MTVLVTGASRGIGRRLVQALEAAGHHPVAAVRDPGRAGDLFRAGIPLVRIDVTDGQSVLDGVADATRQVGSIDVLVNNAGFGTWGPVEAATPAELQAQLDTNLLGPHRMCRAVLPGMRARGSGLLVHLSSIAGRVAVPGFALYCAAKWGLEALAEALRYEVSPFGIDSVLVEPGAYATDFHGSSMRKVEVEEPAYAWLAAAQERRRAAAQLGDPAEVVDAVVRLIEMPAGQRPARVVVGRPLDGALHDLNAQQWEATRRLLAGYGEPDMIPGVP